MARDDQSVAPKERVNITYKAATGDQTENVELPLKILVVGDFTGKPDPVALEDRKAINIDKDTFDGVMEAQKLTLNLSVPDKLSDRAEEAGRLSVTLEPKSIRDFTPDAIVKVVPELQQLMKLREALVALKHPINNNKAFRKKLESIMKDEASLAQLAQELLSGDGDGSQD
jgi:type VI secretion system protein ImpB